MRILSPLFVLGLLTTACGGPGNEQAVSPTDVATTRAALSLITATPTALNFGNQSVGTTSAPQTVTLYNGGSQSMFIAVFWTQQGLSPFDYQIPAQFKWELPAGESTTFTITYTPTAAQADTDAIAVIAYRGSTSDFIILSLTGTGTSP